MAEDIEKQVYDNIYIKTADLESVTDIKYSYSPERIKHIY
jgi:UDP-N-acetyl-D-mannosaminuronate dehydrogenase